MSMLTVSRSAFNIFTSFANDSGCVSLWRNSSVLPHRPKTWWQEETRTLHRTACFTNSRCSCSEALLADGPLPQPTRPHAKTQAKLFPAKSRSNHHHHDENDPRVHVTTLRHTREMISECNCVLRFAERSMHFCVWLGKLGYFLVSRSPTAVILLFYFITCTSSEHTASTTTAWSPRVHLL